jgi:tripartite-type tricarboxylate transporter receptor subunit TctC
MQATIAGETQVLFAGGESAGQFKAGTLRPLAVSGKARSQAMPDVPTIGETYPGYAVDIWLGLFAPAGTPKPIIDKLRTIVQAELAKPEVAAKINVSGSLMPLILSQDEFAARIKSDDEKFGKLAKELNVHIQ